MSIQEESRGHILSCAFGRFSTSKWVSGELLFSGAIVWTALAAFSDQPELFLKELKATLDETLSELILSWFLSSDVVARSGKLCGICTSKTETGKR